MDIAIVSQIDDDEWRQLIASDPRASLFHEPWVLRAFARHMRSLAPRWIELRTATGRLCGGLPFAQRRRGLLKAWSSGPSGSYGGPLVDLAALGAEADAARSRLLREYTHHDPLRVVRRELVYGHEAAPPNSDLRCIDSALLRTDCDFETFLRDRFPKNRRNECSRSERRGMSVYRTTDRAELAAFHAIYSQRNREWGAELLPVGLMWELVETTEAFSCFVAKQAGEIVGGHLCARERNELFAWVGTTRRMSDSFPSSLLVREEVRLACESGLLRLNLGSSLGLSGVLNYKRLLGAESRPLWVLRRESAPVRLLGLSRSTR